MLSNEGIVKLRSSDGSESREHQEKFCVAHVEELIDPR